MFFATERLLQTFWDPVWIDEDGEEAIDRIKAYVISGKGRSVGDALDILKGLRLKCNAINRVIKAIKLNQN